MKKAISALSVGLLAAAGCVHVNVTEDVYADEFEIYDPDVAAIEAVVLDYFDGQGEASLERLQRAFHPDSSMFGVMTTEDGDEYLRVWPKMSEVIENWAANENPPGAGRDGQVLSIEVVDERLAVVTFRYADRFYDAFTMVKLDGEWKIAAKTFVRQ
ncbi:MAG: nuclear transport factor 2 family protein [Hyphomonadaceae bacterium]|nr:nuclear transport factor 2 family protein [Hyphomonadaceae bacterium]